MKLGIDQIIEWMRSNRLQLNPEKTDFVGCATRSPAAGGSMTMSRRSSLMFSTGCQSFSALSTRSVYQWRLFVAGHRQVISRISKGSQNIFIYNFIITTFDSQSRAAARAEAFMPGICPGMLWYSAATAVYSFFCHFTELLPSTCVIAALGLIPPHPGHGYDHLGGPISMCGGRGCTLVIVSSWLSVLDAGTVSLLNFVLLPQWTHSKFSLKLTCSLRLIPFSCL